jgi:FdhD protein
MLALTFAMADAVQPMAVIRVDDRGSHAGFDAVATERALEVRLEGEPFAVIMCTPGADADLAIGFLFSEGLLRGRDDIRRVEAGGPQDVVNVRLSRSRAEALPALFEGRRLVTANASCGICGRRSLEALVVSGPPLPVRWSIPGQIVAGLPDRLRAVQGAFDETGGLHAAALFDREGRLEASAEDVGRHNAVDKLLGRMLTTGRVPLEDSVLLVSGRASFEIVQKAFSGGIPLVAAVSAPSSLAVDLARETGITLAGFVRNGRFNSYAHHERIEPNRSE